MMADTDQDGLSDREEIVTHGSDPTDADTDSDGLSDADELDLPTEFDNPDTDDDGTLDGNETFSTTAANERLDVAVELTGQGNLAKGVTIENQTANFAQGDRIGNMSVSDIVEIESDREFESANVTFSYNDSLGPAENESDLMVVTYDPEKQLYVPLNSTLDPENNTISAETEHFSTFAVFSISNWVADVTAHEVPERGDAGAAQPVDVVFIIDSSGSMGRNDPNNFRKQAATEFVGGLIEGDRASVVDFDGSAHVAQGLTTNFSTVNSSIRSLDAFGGTNIGNGISQANQHFASAGNDSRAQVAILLTDGRGSGGRSQAQTAADRNITLHTIGFGGANGNKLSDIADITNGTYHYVDSAADLPNVFSRVAGELPTDTDGDGLPDVAETEGIPIGHAHGEYQTVETNPTKPDTDDDGVGDGTEVGSLISENVTVSTVPAGGGHVSYGTTKEVHVEYRKLNSDPTKADTDGDGLTDFEEREGWKIHVTDSREQTIQLFETLSDVDSGSELTNLEDYYRIENVSSDPLVKDTSNNGLTDLEERRLGTDPRSTDTTGDGIEDHRAVGVSADPTLYDARPPEIEVPYSWWNKPAFSFDTHYDLQFRAEDPAGLGTGRVLLAGEEQKRHSLEGQSDYANSEFTTGFFDTVTDTYSGTSVTVAVSDVNGNTGRSLAIQRHDIFGEVASKLAEEGVIGREQIKSLGTLSGFSTGAVETAEMIRGFLSDPVGYVSAIGDVIAQLDNLDEIIRQLPASIDAQQDRNNPYKDGTGAYAAYRMGWYEGYIGYMVLESALPAGELGRAAKSSNTLQKTVKTLDKTGNLRTAAKYTAKAADTAYAPVRYTSNQLSRGLAASKGLASDGAHRLLAGAKTAGQKIRQAQLVEMLDRKQLQRLSPDEQRAVGSILAEGGESAGRAMAEGGPGPFARLHRIGDDIDGVNSEDLADAFGHASNQGVDMSRIERLVDDLDTLQRADVDGLDGLATRLSTEGTIDNFKNLAYEADVAATLQRQGDDVLEVGKDVKTADGSTEIDVQMKSGSTIEVKNGDLTTDYKTQLERQLKYRGENSLSGNHYVKVSGEITDEMESFINSNNIRVFEGNALGGTIRTDLITSHAVQLTESIRNTPA